MDKEKLAEIEKRMNEMTKGLKPTSDTPIYIPRIKYNPIPVDAASCKAYPRTCWLAKTVWHDRGFQCTHCLAVAEDAKAINHRET
jgi:hypothetical protein